MVVAASFRPGRANQLGGDIKTEASCYLYQSWIGGSIGSTFCVGIGSSASVSEPKAMGLLLVLFPLVTKQGGSQVLSVFGGTGFEVRRSVEDKIELLVGEI